MASKARRLIWLYLLLGGGVGCGSVVRHKQGSASKAKIASEGDAKRNTKTNLDDDLSDTGRSGVNYMQLFCKNVTTLKLRYDITPEVSRLCQGGQPTDEFRTFRREGIELGASAATEMSLDGSVQTMPYTLRYLKNERDQNNDRSTFELMWVFHVNTRPYIVKKQPLYDFVARGASDPVLDLKVEAQRLAPETLTPGGLHLWSTKMSYDLEFTALDNLKLRNQRSTEYNLYQVVSGNEEIGLGVEHLTDSPDGSYATSSMVNVAFNDGRGFNDDQGGTIVINFLRFEFNNAGFPESSEKVFWTIANTFAKHMYDGLTAVQEK